MRKEIHDFGELIGQVLPLDHLTRTGRSRAASPLERATTQPLEEVARLALARLGGPSDAIAGADAAVAIAEPRAPGETETEVLVEDEPPTFERPAVVAVPRASLPDSARVASGQIGRLMRLGDPMLASDPRRGEARADLVRHIERAALEVLGPVSVRLVTPGPLDERAREAQAHPEVILCEGDSRARGEDVRAWLGLVSARGEPLGVLEVSGLSSCADHDLALVALLGDYAAGVLERAARVENLVFVDPMTGAYNRSYFEIQMQNEMARAERDSSGMAVCIADIDDFKSFNTRFGYEGGNQVLVRVALALKSGVRPFDTVARWGGEEFAVLLSAPVLAQDVVTVAERLRGLVERLTVQIVALDGSVHHVRITVSLGAALYPGHGADPATLWRTANVALLEAKRPPKNRVVFGRQR